VLWKVGETPWDNQKILDTLKKPRVPDRSPAVVTSASPQEAVALMSNGTRCR
jgi:penicillin-binding protein 1A